MSYSGSILFTILRTHFRCVNTCNFIKFSVYAKLLETLINSVLERCSIQIIRCHLIYVIIQPVRIQVIAMRSPGQHWFLLWIVVRIIILRNLWIQSFPQISLILGIQCHSIILRMSHYKDLTSILRHAKINSCFFRICKNCNSVIFFQ